MDTAINVAVRDIEALGGTIQCERNEENGATSHSCMQSVTGDEVHGAILSQQSHPARGPAGAGVHVAGVSAGPGGSASTYSGRTGDGAFDVSASDTQNLMRGAALRLPPPADVVAQIIARYDASK